MYTTLDLIDSKNIGDTEKGFYNYLLNRGLYKKTAQFLAYNDINDFDMQNIKEMLKKEYIEELEFAYDASRNIRSYY